MFSGLSKAETQALTNYGSGEDENEEEEMEEFEAGPVDVQTSLQASADGQVEQEVGGARGPTLLDVVTLLEYLEAFPFSGADGQRDRGGELRTKEFRE